MTTEPPKKPMRGLGRGLDALLPSTRPAEPAERPRGSANYGDGNVFVCPIEKVVPNKGQPRRHFDSQKLDELAQSIREHGLIEPLVVRKRAGFDDFDLIAGERRWRASQRAGLKEVLVVVRDVSAKEAYELALIENIQREDLNPVEFAEAINRLVEEHQYTHDTLAKRLGKERSTISNALRLLRLPAEVRERVITGELSEGHARALLGVTEDPLLSSLAEKVLRGKLNVRQTEELVRGEKSKGKPKPGGPEKAKSASVRDLELRLSRKLGTKVEVKDRGQKGELLVHYASLDELDRILEILL